MRSAAKVVAINALVVLLVFSGIIWAICLATSIYQLVRAGSKETIAVGARRKANVPNYANTDWALTHFMEFDTLPTKYVSYIGWRRLPFAGKTITIEGPYAQRRTVGPKDASKPSVYFFGGSTMWGTGADDANTIPSQFAQLTGYRAENFGESAYTAHQGLMMLIRLLQDGHRPDVVVFYDGANDVVHKCRSELNPWSHGREGQIASALQTASVERDYGLQYMFRPLVGLAHTVSGLLFRRSRDDSTFFNCHADPDKAQQIANYVLEDWELARKLVEAYNGKFIGILQPVSYFSETKLERIRQRDTERKQFQAVYPLIKQKMAERPWLYDFTQVLDKQEYIYIDFCHLSPNGNSYVAQKLVQTLVK
jgi:hypothetical protein